MDEKDPRVVDALNHLLITAIEKRWTTLLLEAGKEPIPIEASGPWDDDKSAAHSPEQARAMIERLAVLSKIKPGPVEGRGSFAMMWDKVTAQLLVSVEKTPDGLRAFVELVV